MLVFCRSLKRIIVIFTIPAPKGKGKMKKITVLLFVFILSLRISFAQVYSAAQTPAPDTSSYIDPIVATLDSLVSLNCLNKLGYPSQCVQNMETFRFVDHSDEEYRALCKKLNSPIPMDYNQYVREYIELYAKKKPYLTARVLGLSQLYFPLFEQVLDQEGLPLEFRNLAIVESALNPIAVSRAGATGLWQFIYTTGKMYGLDISSYIDERRDPYKATLAACQYFKNMYAIYHDWLLVVAAYNCGERNVNKAIARSGGKTNFWEIRKYLPRETRGYVPAFIAVNYVMKYAGDYNIKPTAPAISFYETDTVDVTGYLAFEQIQTATGIEPQLLEYLNPMYKKHFIPSGDVHYKVVLPANKTALFIANAEKLYLANNTDTIMVGGLPSDSGKQYRYVTKEVKKIHTVKSGDRLASLARMYDCTTSDIKQWNHFRGNAVRPGQKLTVYVTVTEKIPLQVPAISADTTSAVKPLPSQDLSGIKYVYHTVQPGDTLNSIALQYQGVTAEQLKQLNNITDVRRLLPGMQLKVIVGG